MNYDPHNNGGQSPYYSQYHTPQYDSTAKNMGTASLILGIIGVTFGGLLCGIAGLILAIMAGNRGYKEGVRTAGLVLSVIAVVYGILVTIVSIILFYIIFTRGPEYLSVFVAALP